MHLYLQFSEGKGRVGGGRVLAVGVWLGIAPRGGGQEGAATFWVHLSAKSWEERWVATPG